ncbi:DUF3560 domain-containing protein [Pelosinus baikalensis]|uniref:DUF3560 domain-containing protein n=1 Tax=Pelosinus baikalensis TaxID=2892015 RepID=A0ABS8HXZ8_9FIRM|nr:DUF3560 domain-containing protein [Pelosinus baikalensis]MCC5468020.1 DUF3560 domain-containing protein [Pelosinus baikalensis]
MNNYEMKQEARKERYMQLADKAQQESNVAHSTARKIGSFIPFGQPILVGHHSEKRHRRDIAKIENNMRKAVALTDKAKYYSDKAASVGKGGISSDDPSAIQKLKEQLQAAERNQEIMKAANKAIKKGDDAALRKLGFTDSQIVELKKPDYMGRVGYAPFSLTNNNANIRRLKKRIEELENKAKMQPKEIEHEGFTYCEEDNRCQFIFSDKPDDETRALLKSHAFKWSPSRGAWVRMLNGNGRYAADRVISKLKAQNA